MDEYLKKALKTISADELQMAAEELNASAAANAGQITAMRAAYPAYDELCRVIETSGATDKLMIRYMAGMEYLLRALITIAENRSSSFN